MKTATKSADLLVESHISRSLQMVSEIKLMHGTKFGSSQNATNVSCEGAKGNNVSVTIDTDVKAITLRCYYLYVLWECDCIRGVKRTCNTGLENKQPAATAASTHH